MNNGKRPGSLPVEPSSHFRNGLVLSKGCWSQPYICSKIKRSFLGRSPDNPFHFKNKQIKISGMDGRL